MPTSDKTDRFQADWEKLDDDTRERFRVAVVRFIEDLGTGQFRKGLRVNEFKEPWMYGN